MMTGRRMQIIVMLLLATALANCGGSNSPNTATTFSDNINSFTAMSTTVAGNTATGASGMAYATNLPTSGTATYNGYAAILISNANNSADGAVLVSPAELTADFSNKTIDGSASAFTGRNANLTDPNNVTYTGPEASYAGKITLSNGCIASSCAAGTTSTVKATASGALSGGGNTVSLTNSLTGNLYGSSTQAVDISGTSAGGSATLNGAKATSSVEFVGQK